MRVRTAKQRAQRIDLNYFKHAHGMRRWRTLLSAALPVAALLWIGGAAAAGSRRVYSAGPVASAHAFAEQKCEVCHSAATRAGLAAHASNQTSPPACAACHQEHRGRVQIAKTDDRFCLACHGDLKTTRGKTNVGTHLGTFSQGHPEFAAVRAGAVDPGRVRFNHAVHMKDSLRGPAGPEKLECATCHKPEVVRAAVRGRKPATTGLMAPIAYQQQCARCHPLFFDERLEQAAPHARPELVHAFVQQALAGYIRQNPDDMSKPDSAFRRVPLNFPRPPEPPARTAQEWVARRTAVDERILWNKTCAECHEPEAVAVSGLPAYAPTNIMKQWMPRASFDHAPHGMVTCTACHAAETSTKTSDVLLPNQAACATCHSPSDGVFRLGSGRAESRCFECHRYHDWTKTHPVTSSYSLMDFK